MCHFSCALSLCVSLYPSQLPDIGVLTNVDRPAHQFTETTEVEFAELSDKEIAAYVSTKEPLDKAGETR